ncbi:MAG: HNH endonuclease [Chloroflexi bacterium]|nr:MAG: HNH endonuclease [Chloroflexota bacterium]TMC26627.1 MAG: HNH endonuclease [Chloroflexota bacterium]TMC37001.1 MAG: HNH endonuclease [Chloroflexota bacterium]TME43083.1 MAG: HNH endonuclease [Chloroflexota bacterium]
MRPCMAYKDPARRRAYGREWMKRNPEKARAAMRRWRAAHPDEHKAERRAYYRRHRESELAKNLAYHRAHREVRKASDSRRRVWKLGGGPSFTAAEWLQLVVRYGGRCAYRGEEGPLQADHRIPLSRGGSNGIDNILPACRRCNAEKANMTEDEFRARLELQQRDNLEFD